MKKIWFRRKLYGWGWYPSTWQGWLIIISYCGLIALFAFTIDATSPPKEVAFTFIFPIIFLTITLLRIVYKTGEKPRWQWGKRLED